jgi:hypothetical protein
MKKHRVPVFLCLLVCSLPCFSQTSTPPDLEGKFAAVGLGLFQSATPQLQGFGLLALPVGSRVLSYTDYDVAAIPGAPVPGRIILPRLQFSMRTGFAVRIYQLSPRISLYGLGGAGMAATGDNVVGSFGGGGFIDIAIGKGWGALIILEASRNAVTGTEFIPRVGIRIKL